MTDRPKLTQKGAAEAARRQERLAAALRENLRKRKEQARGREASDDEPEPGAA